VQRAASNALPKKRGFAASLQIMDAAWSVKESRGLIAVNKPVSRHFF
jgi:hypothetical protein